MNAVYVHGLGLWTPQYPSWDAWTSAQCCDPPAEPVNTSFDRSIRRRLTTIGHVASMAITQATAGAGMGTQDVQIVLASVGGELQHAFSALSFMAEDPPSTSALRFGISVQNAALGQLSSAWQNIQDVSAIAASVDALVVTALWDAMGRLFAHQEQVVVVWAEDTWPVVGGFPAAFACVLGRHKVRSTLSLAPPMRLATAGTQMGDVAHTPYGEEHPMRDAFRLAHALAQGRSTRLVLGDRSSRDGAWSIDVLSDASP